ncbi:type 1 glutamine amidotransferase domain-containing protein [Actinocrinis sp.]|jgi:putative intracellular protease/amidase|uniref:type 1 glutamine amidotransferase domain-containing protein n=1 Tax=Actinocrinis sp. TaxID=1920516 RepID=UPI002C704AC3|nr:type 1 glutamine amidotransferase domain-containing protein [Actinocrinis sp.]HXR72568.1 type 1 glutamine amidotransferase domain-containing protein [Actinocrinis sp.]
MSKSILTVLSEYGYWGEELVGPLAAFDRRGYEVTFATPTGGRAHALPPSMDPEYVDPPLGRSVTTPEVAEATRKLDESDRLDNPLSIEELIPDRPYFSEPDFLRRIEAYHRELDTAQRSLLERYDALVLVGGSGPIVDMANNGRLHEIVLAFHRADRPILGLCYGVTPLAFAREWEQRDSILRGKHVTGHPKEYDYKAGTGFLGTDFNIGAVPYPLEYILRDATAPDGRFHGNVGKETSVIVDYPFVTARSTPDSFLGGEKLVEMLEHGLRRYGW